MDRKPIKVGQLLAILNQRLMRYTETSRCRITSISPLFTTSKEQCNWSSAVGWNDNGQNRNLAAPVINKLIMHAQKEFNLLPFGANALA